MRTAPPPATRRGLALRPSALAALAVLALAGCSLAPKYEQPAAPIATAWPGQPAAPASAAQPAPLDLADLVTDAALRELLDAALQSNRDLRRAVLNVAAVRAQYGIQRADRLPTLDLQAGGQRQRTPADLSTSGAASTASSYQAGLGIAAFELDLFGRVHNLSESAFQELLAAEHQAQAARLSLVTEVLQSYLLRDGALRRLDLTERTLAARVAAARLMAERRAVGAASALDFEEANGLVAQARADLEQVQREVQQATNALRLLVGLPDIDGLLARVPAPQTVFAVQNIAAGAPSTLLHSRPDIQAAESQLRARTADIGVARAAFFPRISLTAFMGSTSAELSRLFSGGQGAWSFAPQLSLPLFDAGRNRASLALAEVRRDMAVAQYEGSIQTAFREVADALAANDTLRRELGHREDLLRSSRHALSLAQARYQGGMDSHLRLLDAQRAAYASEMHFIDVATQRQVALVHLFRALGGRWNLG
jgi:multidrug efflux system outer membrane protein